MNYSIKILLLFCIIYAGEKPKITLKDLSGFSKKIELDKIMPDSKEFEKDKIVYPYQIEEIKKKSIRV